MPPWVRIAAVLLLCMSACNGDEPTRPKPTTCPTSPPIETSSPFLEKFPLSDWGTIVGLETKGKYVSVEVVADTTVVELHPQVAREVIDRHYKIIGADNEGFESEIYFARHGKFYGAFRLREGPCKGQVTLRLLYLKKPTKGTKIPSLTRSPTPTPTG